LIKLTNFCDANNLMRETFAPFEFTFLQVYQSEWEKKYFFSCPDG